MYISPSKNLICVMLGILALLFFSHIFVLLLAKIKKDVDFSNLKLRMQSWWIIVFFLSFIIFGTRTVSLCATGILCFLALKEFFSFLPIKLVDRRLMFWAYLAIPIQMYLLYIDWIIMFYLFVPLYMFLFIPIRRILDGLSEDFIKTIGVFQWAMMLTVYSLGYVGAYMALPLVDTPYCVNGSSLLLYLLILNSLNDAFQYIWGKLFGKRKIVPKISPNKTWEGFLGGVISTTILSVIIAPFLTPMGHLAAFFAGILISVFGFFGDVVLSAIKRDANVKDGSSLIPGHGGVLDRVDSLIYTAPLFFHYFCYIFQRLQ